MPPPCPEGQHRDEGECRADHECGPDEIGGGAEECEPCGEGEVPDTDGTACRSCPHGESGDSTGVCAADPCGRDATDHAAIGALGRIPKEPRERGMFLFCKDGRIGETEWKVSEDSNLCGMSVSSLVPYPKSCWRGGSRETGCNLSLVHTHPWFTWPESEGFMCNGEEIQEPEDADDWNAGGMEFSTADVNAANTLFVEGQLGVSDRSCARALRRYGWKESIAGTCTPEHLLPAAGGDR